ncbi:MAG TPA: oxidoreductase [Pseudomonadaceae bacterium]|nr:oxidoreductase [Pseudomonadaceae bacterium]
MESEYLLAAGIAAAYLLLCWHFLGHLLHAPRVVDVDAADCVLVAYASQGGQARQLAQDYADILQSSSSPVLVTSLNKVNAPLIRKTSLALFIVSTYGEGEPPDNALRFARQWLQGNNKERLSHLRFAVLALGDRQYQQFCAFGCALAKGLSLCGASQLFETVQVDSMNTLDLANWQQRLALHGLTSARMPPPAVSQEPALAPWQLQRRICLNPGSPGGSVWHLRLVCRTGPQPEWLAGDIAQILPANDPAASLREYSIASIPTEGAIDLVVRQVRRADGSLGQGSGWLTELAQPGDDVLLTIRSNPAFQPPCTTRPMILIGNGTGLAGLRAHLQAREIAGARRNCLFFGERTRSHDFLFQDELLSWQHAGHLPELHLAFSRDQAQRRYVQHLLLEQAALVRDWVEAGAVIYVCGSLEGMEAGVRQALQTILGEERLEAMLIAGDLRRDVY